MQASEIICTMDNGRSMVIGKLEILLEQVLHFHNTFFFTLEPAHPSNYLKINFHGNVLDKSRCGPARFMIRGPSSSFVVAKGFPTYDIMVPIAKLRRAWMCIRYPALVL